MAVVAVAAAAAAAAAGCCPRRYYPQTSWQLRDLPLGEGSLSPTDGDRDDIDETVVARMSEMEVKQ